jgi:hypothetical protein
MYIYTHTHVVNILCVDVSSLDILSRNEESIMMQDQSQHEDTTSFILVPPTAESKNLTSSLALLICSFSLLILMSLIEFGLLLL